MSGKPPSDKELRPETKNRLATILEQKGPEVLREVAELFNAASSESLAAIREALATKNASRLVSSARELGDACNSIGATSAENICRELETVGMSTSPFGPVVLIYLLDRELDCLSTGIAELLETDGSKDSPR